MDISIPMKASDLKHHAKNFAGMAGKMFGQTSVQHHSLKQIQTHIEEREVSYNYEFKQDPLFGGNFLDRANWRYHRFLDSCASGDPDAIELDKLDFSDMLQQVERREYNSKVPSWITKLIKSCEQKPFPSNDYGDRYNRGGGGGGGNRGRSGDLKRRSFNNKNDSERSVRVNNSNQHDLCKIRSDESYKDISIQEIPVVSRSQRKIMERSTVFVFIRLATVSRNASSVM